MAYLKPGQEPPTKGKGAKLSAKMEKAVELYLADPEMNMSKAVVGAGYKTKNPNRLATELLRHPLVKEKIDEAIEERKERIFVDQDWVLLRLQQIVEAQQADNPQAALRGLELLGKHLGLYRERTEISGPDGEAIKMEQKVKEDAADFTRQLSRLARRAGTGEVAEFPKPGSTS